MAFEDRSRLKVVYAPVLDLSENIPDVPLPTEVEAARASGHTLILFAGKVSIGKGADVMFSAARRLATSHPDARLVVCGNLHPGAWDFDRTRTILPGFVDQAMLAKLYAVCDIVLLPSTWPEPLGWSTLDAGRHGKPIVATRVGGIPEAIVDGQTGLLVEKGDDTAMANALARLLDDHELASSMGRRAREHIETHFGERAVSRQLDALYQGLN
jgi:glycosyltransferase involved in cell wall biosynthesis